MSRRSLSVDVFINDTDNDPMQVTGQGDQTETLDVEELRARLPQRPGSLSAARLALDAVTIAVATGVAVFLRFGLRWFEVTESSPLTVRSHVAAGALWVASSLTAMTINRLYDEDTLFPGGGEKARILRSMVEAAAAIALFVFVTQSFYVSRSWFALTLVLSGIGLAAERQAVRAYLQKQRARGRARRPCFLVSKAREAWTEWYDIRNEEFEVLAELDPQSVESLGAAVVADPSLRRRLTGSALVLRARDFNSDEFWQLVLRAGQLQWSVFVHSPVRSVGRDRLSVRDVAGHTIVKVTPPSLGGIRAFEKRALDLMVSLLAFVVLVPALVVISLAIALTAGMPILYHQERVGLKGRTFTMWKFRTMVLDAEAETGPVWASERDERRTAIGAWLRRTSLDELPQLWNVLKGDMSLVGPRPERPTFVHEFERSYPWYEYRHRIRPGVTGWAQAQGLRGDTELSSRIDSDNWYIENWSIWLDMRILASTAAEIFRGRNAY